MLGHDRFSELNPSGIDSNLYNYHLHQLISMHYVEKTEGNRYHLTETGKAEGVNWGMSLEQRLASAHSILLLYVQDKEGHLLLRKRTVHPMFGKIGFLHGEPTATESLETSAAVALKKRTGLQADFHVAGSGFIRILDGEHIESFVSFTMLCAVMDSRELLISSSETGENFWTDKSNPDLSHPDMLPSMTDLAKLCSSHSNSHFFFDKTYNFK